ncbi:Uncharacterised protein [Chromobacterium violaceum]|uniref:Uncharacterized protein n=1 Tax=Chromobacterium violaceum TaxID=536 RepID=A0A447T4F9_CHRVL|nr:Uncharacterised protein [Chromobacterium violaceum]
MGYQERKKQSIWRPVFQMSGRLGLYSKNNPEHNANTAIDTIIAWLSEKQKIALPDIAFRREPFEIDASNSYPVEAVNFDGIWSVEFNKPDADVPGRIWRTEATVACLDENSYIGVRLSIIDSVYDTDYVSSIPSFIPTLIDDPGIDDYNTILSNSATRVSTPEEALQLISLIKNENRTRPVVLFTESSVISVKEEAIAAAKRLAGLAHIFVVSSQGTRTLTEQLGREFSVWGGAIRTYLPKFNSEIDEAFTHKLATREWIQKRFTKFDNFLNALLQSFAPATVSHSEPDAVPSFRKVKQAWLNKKIKESVKGKELSEREALQMMEIDLLNQRIREKEEEFIYAAEEERKAVHERDQYRAQLLALRALNERLEKKLGDEAKKIELPDKFDKIQEWVRANFPSKILLHTKAAKAAEKSRFNNPRLVYQCLMRLANEYREHRINGLPLDGIFDDLGVHLCRTGDPEHLKQWREEYYISHRNKNHCLEWHLKKGADKNEITTLRIYFFYDDDDEMVVVGHLPSHLTNDMT